MRAKDPELKKTIVAFVNEFYSQHNRTPRLREIGDALGTSRQTAMRYLKEMQEEGELSYDNKGVILTKEIAAERERKTQTLPVVGMVAAGVLTTAVQEDLGTIQIPTAWLSGGEHFVLQVSGLSMIGAGIQDGDLVIVRKTPEAEIGQIVVAIDDEGQTTLKRLAHDGERYYLHPENEDFPDIYPEELRLQGVVTGLYHQFEE